MKFPFNKVEFANLYKPDGSDFKKETREEFIKRIESEGRYVWKPKNNELFIDIDTEEQYETFSKMWSSLQMEYPDVYYDEWFSNSGYPRRHIVVTLPFKVNTITRIAYQAAMGSDPVRELLSIFRIENGIKDPTLFAENERR